MKQSIKEMENLTLRELKIKAKELNIKIYSVKKRRSVKNNWYGYAVSYAKVLSENTVSTQKEVEIEGNLGDVLYHFKY